MEEKYQYRLTKNQKKEIAQNLIDITDDISKLSIQTRNFICKWVAETDPEDRGKTFTDVWEIVLKNYLPKPESRPILYRSCRRRTEDKIKSFTGRFECARRMSEGKGLLIICDTSQTLFAEERFYQPGQYRHTYYPLAEVLKKGEFLLDHAKKEDEYIMRVSSDMHSFRWKK